MKSIRIMVLTMAMVIPLGAVTHKKPVSSLVAKKQVRNNSRYRFNQQAAACIGIGGIMTAFGLGSLAWYKQWWLFGKMNVVSSEKSNPSQNDVQKTLQDAPSEEITKEESLSSDDQLMHDNDGENNSKSSTIKIELQEQSFESQTPQEQQGHMDTEEHRKVNTALEEEIRQQIIAEKEKELALIEQEIAEIKAAQKAKTKRNSSYASSCYQDEIRKKEEEIIAGKSVINPSDIFDMFPKQKEAIKLPTDEEKRNAIQDLLVAEQQVGDPKIVATALNTLFKGINDDEALKWGVLEDASRKDSLRFRTVEDLLKSLSAKYTIGHCPKNGRFAVSKK